jgi:hypothetical protein
MWSIAFAYVSGPAVLRRRGPMFRRSVLDFMITDRKLGEVEA